jgi:membrane peptidoglycan carboxypeptidase
METAVLICEDSRFFRHDGFDQEAIESSIRQNVIAQSFLRGASTISMQLAKNLYLESQKTVARKLQEAVLTLLLEQRLDKQQILELYLNVIEFGPGIYGIGPAAQHFFNTTPAELSLGQALYLASILPRPSVQYFASDGSVTPRRAEYLRKLMHIAHKIHRITEEELEDALEEQVTFGVPQPPRVPVVDETVPRDGAELGVEAPPPPADASADDRPPF